MSRRDLSAPTSDDPLVIPAEVLDLAESSIGQFFEPISRVPPRIAAVDFLDSTKSVRRGQILGRYVELRGKRVLEVGCGFGTNLVRWSKEWSIDGYGVEPGASGFSAAAVGARKILSANGIEPYRVIDAVGENLPFRSASFDVVYSANVLEHTQDPQRVLEEAVRVLKPGGILHFEVPNHLSYFEGHYMVIQPPLVWKSLLPLWVRLLRRDPTYARTLRTELNPVWFRRVVRRMSRTYPLTLLSLGDEIFLERLQAGFAFETQLVSDKLARVMAGVQWLNRANWMGRVIVALQGFYPMYVTIRKA